MKRRTLLWLVATLSSLGQAESASDIQRALQDPRVQQMLNDPGVAERLADPAVQQMIRDPEAMRRLADPQLIQRYKDSLNQPGASDASGNSARPRSSEGKQALDSVFQENAQGNRAPAAGNSERMEPTGTGDFALPSDGLDFDTLMRGGKGKKFKPLPTPLGDLSTAEPQNPPSKPH